MHASREHAKITMDGDSFILTDLKSRNGTLVNNSPVRKCSLQGGDEVRIGDFRYVFLLRPHEEQPSLRADEIKALPDLQRGRTITIRMRIPPDETGSEAAPAVYGEKLQKHVDVLHDMARIMAAEMDQPDLLREICDTMIRAFSAERVCILLHDKSTERLAPASLSLAPGVEDPDLPMSQTIIDTVASGRTSILCTDATADHRLDGAQSISAMQIRSVMCTPFINRGHFLGVAYLDNRSAQ
jgi:adenylate cyclase